MLLVVVAVVWFAVFLVLKCFEARTGGVLSRFLQERNISLYLGYVSWTTTRFNAPLMSAGAKHRRWLDGWFGLGMAFGLLGLVLSVVLLLANLFIVLRIGFTEISAPITSDVQRLATSIASGALELNASLSASSAAMQRAQMALHTTHRALHAAEVAVEHTASTYGEVLRVNAGLMAPLVPGVNLPHSQIVYVLLALLISVVLHEAGHALAAGVEDLRVTSVGGFFALIFPGAFVQIDGLEQINVRRQLKVYCAGAWHNVVVAALCAVLVVALPVLLAPLYVKHKGSVVISVPRGSALSSFLSVGDVVGSIGHNPTPDRESFAHALAHLKFVNESRGFCMAPGFVRMSSTGSGCCAIARAPPERFLRTLAARQSLANPLASGEHTQLQSELDDYRLREPREPTELRSSDEAEHELGKSVTNTSASEHEEKSEDANLITTEGASQEVEQPSAADSRIRGGSQCFKRLFSNAADDSGEMYCIPPRLMKHIETCEISEDCQKVELGADSSTSTREAQGCYSPVLPAGQKLIEIVVRTAGEERQIFFQGQPEVLARSIVLSDYRPRLTSLAGFWWYRAFVAWNLPRKLDRLLRYTLSISLCLAVLNMAPVYFLDGEASAILFVRLLFPRIKTGRLEHVKAWILKTGTALLICNILVSLSAASAS
uniref:Endopeptidase S2P n=1 Tax=Erythrolobus australicus TaxID=1077150 RepID=A0A7S1TQ45_9RHOD|mmetsp:Transcript_843/g.2320  ORF Transcript_843/g.2320 Transcript_843/m.2320 type:complete len:660 (+) Transcript_843:31-2010(+)